jgi:phage shock protein A
MIQHINNKIRELEDTKSQIDCAIEKAKKAMQKYAENPSKENVDNLIETYQRLYNIKISYENKTS